LGVPTSKGEGREGEKGRKGIGRWKEKGKGRGVRGEERGKVKDDLHPTLFLVPGGSGGGGVREKDSQVPAAGTDIHFRSNCS